MFIRLTIATACVSIIAACAAKPENIAPAAFPVAAYSARSCNQLSADAARVHDAIAVASEAQDKARRADTVGVILLGIPAASLVGKDRAGTISVLKGEAEAIRQSQAMAGCV